MKRRSRDKNSSGSPKKSKNKSEASSKPPPSPAAKVLTRRALHGGRPSLQRLRRSSESNADQSVNSSMMNTTADATLDTSTFQNVLNKTGWWKNIDQSMLNIPLAELTGDRSQDSTLDNSTDPSKSMAKKKKGKNKKSETQTKQVRDSSSSQEVSGRSQDQDSLNSEATNIRRKRKAFQDFKKAMGPTPKAKAPTTKTADRESVGSDITEEDPPTPQIKKRPKRQIPRVSYATFKKAMGPSPEPPASKVDETAESEDSDITEEDPPTPKTKKQSKRQIPRVSYGTFKKAMGPSPEPPASKVDETAESEDSDITEEDPPTPQTKKQPKRQIPRVSYGTFKKAMGPSPEPPASKVNESDDRESVLSDSTEESPPSPQTPQKQPKKLIPRVSYATFKKAMGPSPEKTASKVAETTDRESVASDITEEDPPTPQTPQKQRKKQIPRVSYATFKKAMGPSPEPPASKVAETADRESVVSDMTEEDPPTPPTPQKQCKKLIPRVSHATFKKAMGPSPEPPASKINESDDIESVASDSTEENSLTPETKKHVKQPPRVSSATFKNAMGSPLETESSTDGNKKSISSNSDVLTDEDSPSPQREKHRNPRQSNKVSHSMFKDAMGSIPKSGTTETIIDSSHVSDNDAGSPSTPEKSPTRKSLRKASEFSRVMQDLSTTASPQQKDIEVIESDDDDSYSEPSLTKSKDKQTKKTNLVTAEMFAAAMQAASVTSSSNEDAQLSMSISDDSVLDTSDRPENKKRRRNSRTRTNAAEDFARAMNNVSPSKSPKSNASLVDPSTPVSARKQLPAEATFNSSVTEHTKSVLSTPLSASKNTSKRVSFSNVDQLLSATNSPGSVHSRHSLTTIQEHEPLNDMTEPVLLSRASHHKSISEVSTPTITILNELDMSDVNQRSTSDEQNKSSAQQLDRSVLTRNSISAFARKGPVRHSESPASPSKSKKRESIIQTNVSKNIQSPKKSTSPEKSVAAPSSPTSSLEMFEDDQSSDQESSKEINKKVRHARQKINIEDIKKAFNEPNVPISPEKSSPKKYTRQSDVNDKTADSSQNLSVSKSPRHSKRIEGNTSSTNFIHNKSLPEMANVSVVLERIDTTGVSMDIDSDTNMADTSKKSSPHKKSSLLSATSTDVTQPSDKFTSVDFNHALQLLEKEIAAEVEEDYESEEESVEEENQPKQKSEKTKFSLSDFKRAMESLDVDGEETEQHHEAGSFVSRKSSRRSSIEPEEPEDMNISISTPRRSQRISSMPTHVASTRRSARLAVVEEMNISTASSEKQSSPTRKSPRKSFHSDTSEVNMSLSSPKKQSSPTRKSPRKSANPDTTEVNMSLSSPRKGILSSTLHSQIAKVADVSKAKVHTPLRFSLPAKDSNKTRKSAYKKRYTLLDFQRAMEAVRSPSFISDIPSIRSIRNSLPKFSVHDFEKAVSTFKADIEDESYSSTSSSRRASLRSSLQHGQKIQTEETKTSPDRSPSKQQDSMNISGRSLRSSPTKAQEDSRTSKQSRKSSSPLKQQELNTSTLSLRSGKTVSPSKQLGNASKTSLDEKTPSPAKQLGMSSVSSSNDNSVDSSQNVPHAPRSSSRTSLAAKYKIAMAKAELASPTKLNKSVGTVVAQSQQRTIAVDTRASKSLGVFGFQQTIKESQSNTEVVPETSLSSGSNVSEEIPIQQVKSISMQSATALLESKINEEIDIEVIDLQMEDSEEKETEEQQETTAPQESSSEVEEDDEQETTAPRESSSEAEEEQETTAPQESSSEAEEEQETTAPQESSLEVEEEEQQETTAPQESSSEEEEQETTALQESSSEVEEEEQETAASQKSISEAEEEQETTVPQESSSEAEEEGQEATAPQESSSEAEEEQEITAPQESSSEAEEEEEQETTVPQESSSEAEEEGQEATAPQESSSEAEEEQEITAPQESSSEAEEEEEQETTAPQESSSEAEEEEEQETTAPQKSSSEAEEEATDKSKAVTTVSHSDGEESGQEENLNNTVLELQPENNVRVSLEKEGNESDGEDTEQAPSLSPTSHELHERMSGIFLTEESIDTDRSLLLSSSQQQEQQNSARRNLSVALSQKRQQQFQHGPRNPAVLQNVLKGINDMMKEPRKTNFEQRKVDAKKKPQLAKAKNVRLPKPIPAERIFNGKVYRKPRLRRPKPWMNDRFYKYLEAHFIKQDVQMYRKLSEDFALELAEYVTKTISSKSKAEEKARKVAKLVKKVGLVKTNMEFFYFSQDYLPEPFVYKAFPYNDGQGVKYIN